MDKDAASIEDVTENVTDPEAVEFLKKNQGISTYIIYMHWTSSHPYTIAIYYNAWAIKHYHNFACILVLYLCRLFRRS